jgi:hypothetical protein
MQLQLKNIMLLFFMVLLSVFCQKPQPKKIETIDTKIINSEILPEHNWTCFDTSILPKLTWFNYDSVSHLNTYLFDSNKYISQDTFFKNMTELKLLSYIGKFGDFQFVSIAGFIFDWYHVIVLLKVDKECVVKDHVFLSYCGEDGGNSENFSSFIRNGSIVYSGISTQCCASITDSTLFVDADSTYQVSKIDTLGNLNQIIKVDTSFIKKDDRYENKRLKLNDSVSNFTSEQG